MTLDEEIARLAKQKEDLEGRLEWARSQELSRQGQSPPPAEHTTETYVVSQPSPGQRAPYEVPSVESVPILEAQLEKVNAELARLKEEREKDPKDVKPEPLDKLNDPNLTPEPPSIGPYPTPQPTTCEVLKVHGDPVEAYVKQSMGEPSNPLEVLIDVAVHVVSAFVDKKEQMEKSAELNAQWRAEATDALGLKHSAEEQGQLGKEKQLREDLKTNITALEKKFDERHKEDPKAVRDELHGKLEDQFKLLREKLEQKLAAERQALLERQEAERQGLGGDGRGPR